MATVPTPEETARAIAACMVNEYNVRAGEIVPLGGIQMKLHPEFKADDINAALAFMQEFNWIAPARSGFISLTEVGFAEA